MKYYSYNSNGIFTGEGLCQIDPLETKAQGKNVYLVPPNTTTKKPTPQDGKVTKWDGSKWIYIDDNRGEYYNTTTKQKVIISDIDGDLTGLTKLDPQDKDEWDGEKWIYNLDMQKHKKLSLIDQKTRSLILNGFIFNDTLFSFSENAQLNWLGLLSIKSSLAYPYDISKKEGGKYTIQDIAEMELFLSTAINHKESIISSGRALQDQILSCTTLEELEIINDIRS